MGMMIRRHGEAQDASPKSEAKTPVKESAKDEKPKTVRRKPTK